MSDLRSIFEEDQTNPRSLSWTIGISDRRTSTHTDIHSSDFISVQCYALHWTDNNRSLSESHWKRSALQQPFDSIENSVMTRLVGEFRTLDRPNICWFTVWQRCWTALTHIIYVSKPSNTSVIPCSPLSRNDDSAMTWHTRNLSKRTTNIHVLNNASEYKHDIW